MLVHDNAPTPKQLFQLAVHGVAIARQHSKLRELARTDGSYVRAAVLPHAESFSPDVEGVPGYTLGRQASMRLERTGLGDWNMFIRSQHHFTQQDPHDDGSLQTLSQIGTYGFRWNPRRTIVAKRYIHVLPGLVTAEYDLADHIDHFSASDDISLAWNAQMQMEQVTADEMPDVMSEMQYLDSEHLLVG